MQRSKQLVSLSVALLICAGQLLAEDAPTPSRADIEKIVREYILQHPEVLLESVQHQRDRERAETQARAKGVIAASRRELFDDVASPVAGTPESEVTIVEFFDYKCGYCRGVAPTVSKLLESHKNVRLIFKELPILAPESHLAARAALAAAKQGAYLTFHRELMTGNAPITPQAIDATATKLGLDIPRWKADMNSKEIEGELTRNQQLANAIGVQSTPSFVIGGELITGAMDLAAFEKLISNNGTR